MKEKITADLVEALGIVKDFLVVSGVLFWAWVIIWIFQN